MTLRYLLTGLVRCGHCSRAMNPTSSAAYVTKSGEAKRYTAYSCPGSVSGVCPNGTRVPEDWLRKVVIGTVRQRLFPGDGHGVPEPDWLAPLIEDVRLTLTQMANTQPDQSAAFEQEIKDLRAKQAGWSISLANRDLNPAIRAAIEAEWAEALTRQQEIEGLMAERASSPVRRGRCRLRTGPRSPGATTGGIGPQQPHARQPRTFAAHRPHWLF